MAGVIEQMILHRSEAELKARVSQRVWWWRKLGCGKKGKSTSKPGSPRVKGGCRIGVVEGEVRPQDKPESSRVSEWSVVAETGLWREKWGRKANQGHSDCGLVGSMVMEGEVRPQDHPESLWTWGGRRSRVMEEKRDRRTFRVFQSLRVGDGGVGRVVKR